MTSDPDDLTDELPWLSVQEIAQRLAVSKMTVHRLINAGTLPAYRFGRSLRVNFYDFRAYVGRSQVTVDLSRPGKIEA